MCVAKKTGGIDDVLIDLRVVGAIICCVGCLCS